MAVFVIYTMAGNEDRIESECRQRILRLGEDVYVPKFDRLKRRHGEIKVIRDILFPGYIFWETEDASDLRLRLRKIPGLTKLLGAPEGVLKLYEEEERLIRKLCGKTHILDVSRGYIEGERVKVISGPLMGMDALICSVNRKKKRAVIRVEMFHKTVEVTVGLEVID